MNAEQRKEIASLTIPGAKSNLDINFCFVTPEMARKWLTKNTDANRGANDSVVSSYAKAMRSGLWQPGTGEAIKFNVNDQLVDGQHRLLAIMRSGTSQWMMVMRGVPMGAMLVIDDGLKRSVADVLKITGREIGGPLRIVGNIVSGLKTLGEDFDLDRVGRPERRTKRTTSEIIQFLDSIKGFNESMEIFFKDYVYNKINRNISIQSAAAAHYLWHDIFPHATKTVIQSMQEGTQVDHFGPNSPSYRVIAFHRRYRNEKVFVRFMTSINQLSWAIIMTDQNLPAPSKLKLEDLPWQFKLDNANVRKAKSKIMGVG